jgi:hypothetical protein
MAGPSVAYTYRYNYPSAIIALPVGPELRLATFGGREEHPAFFRGKCVRPKRAADLLRGVMDVVQSRFHVPAAMLGRILAQADPVVTSGEERLRFEGFSGCCSAYARADLLPDAIRGEWLAHGTTNVDFSPPMQAALAQIRESDSVSLSVGSQELRLDREAGTVVEKKVALPLRWLKGFVEVQAYQSRMAPVLDVSGFEAHRFLRSLPRAKARHDSWVAPMGGGLRLSQVRTAGGVAIAGLERLRVLEPLSRSADRLRVYAEEGGASGWELVFGDSRFHLLLSPDVWRGFSGEGQALSSLASDAWRSLVPAIHARLRWDSAIDIEKLSRATKATSEAVRAALCALGSRGLVGFDLESGCYFHRELPFDLSAVEKLQPRLRAAQKLVADGKVRIEFRDDQRTDAAVQGSGVEHCVRVTSGEARCTCPWFSKYQGSRGPCKHVLAVQMRLEQEPES